LAEKIPAGLMNTLRRKRRANLNLGDGTVEQNVVIHFDGDLVRFTPDGKVSVLDAIGALTQSECPGTLWEDVKEKYPEIMSHCDSYSFRKGQSLPVVDTAGWDKLSIVLMDYLGDSDFSCPEDDRI
jgi:hypothetical protein